MNMTKKRIRTWKARVRALSVSTAVALILGATMVLPRASATTHATTSGYSARALLAQGDAEMGAHHPGRAIADYERARLLAPRSPLIPAALGRARASSGLPPLEESRLASVLGLLSPNEWSWIALAGLGLFAAAVVGLGWGVRRLGFGAFLVGAVVAAGGAAAAVEMAPSPRIRRRRRVRRRCSHRALRGGRPGFRCGGRIASHRRTDARSLRVDPHELRRRMDPRRTDRDDLAPAAAGRLNSRRAPAVIVVHASGSWSKTMNRSEPSLKRGSTQDGHVLDWARAGDDGLAR